VPLSGELAGSDIATQKGPPRFIRWALVVAFGALCVDILLAWNTYGTNDVDMWKASSTLAQGETPIEVYRHRVRVQQINGGIYHELFNHPPLMLFLLGKFAHYRQAISTRRPFTFRITSKQVPPALPYCRTSILLLANPA